MRCAVEIFLYAALWRFCCALCYSVKVCCTAAFCFLDPCFNLRCWLLLQFALICLYVERVLMSLTCFDMLKVFEMELRLWRW